MSPDLRMVQAFRRPDLTPEESEQIRQRVQKEQEIQARQQSRARQIRESLVLPPEALLPVVELEADLIEKLLALRPWQASRGARE